MRKACEHQSYDEGALFDLHFTERRGHPVRGVVAWLGIRRRPLQLYRGADSHEQNTRGETLMIPTCLFSAEGDSERAIRSQLLKAERAYLN